MGVRVTSHFLLSIYHHTPFANIQTRSDDSTMKDENIDMDISDNQKLIRSDRKQNKGRLSLGPESPHLS